MLIYNLNSQSGNRAHAVVVEERIHIETPFRLYSVKKLAPLNELRLMDNLSYGGKIMSFYVYILKCSNGTFYTGSTTNLIERLNNHIIGDNPRAYTYRLRPVKLVWAEEYETRIDALIIEKQIKGWSHAKKQALIDDDFDRIHQIVKQERKKRES